MVFQYTYTKINKTFIFLLKKKELREQKEQHENAISNNVCRLYAFIYTIAISYHEFDGSPTAILN